MSPFGKESINWESVIGIGVLVISGGLGKPPLGISEKSPFLVKMNKSPHRLISLCELLGTYIGFRLWTPGRLSNNGLLWL